MPYRVIKSIAGRRGSALLLFGFIFVPIALSQITVRPAERTYALRWLPEWVTFGMLGWIFMACAIAALLVGLFSKWLPSRFLAIGYGLATIPPSALALLYAGALAVQGVWMGGIVSLAVYAGYTALVLLVGGWEEPRPSPPLTDEQRQMLGGDGR